MLDFFDPDRAWFLVGLLALVAAVAYMWGYECGRHAGAMAAYRRVVRAMKVQTGRAGGCS